MILTCPQCKTKFALPDTILGETGKTVRCSKCAHSWFQTPPEPEVQEPAETETPLIEDEAFDETAIEEESAEDADIFEVSFPAAEPDTDEAADAPLAQPEEAEPPVEEEPVPPAETPAQADKVAEEESLKAPVTPTDEQAKEQPEGLAKLVAIGAAVILFCAILAVLLVLKKPLAQAWPAMNGIYALIGGAVAPEGRGVVFNNLKARIDGDQLMISGDLVNLSTKETALLPMLAAQLDAHETVLKQWIITPPVDHLPSAGVSAFESKYPLENNAVSVKVGFSLEGAIMTEVHGAGHNEESKVQPHVSGGHDAGHDHEAAAPKATPEHAPAPSAHQSPHAH